MSGEPGDPGPSAHPGAPRRSRPAEQQLAGAHPNKLTAFELRDTAAGRRWALTGGPLIWDVVQAYRQRSLAAPPTSDARLARTVGEAFGITAKSVVAAVDFTLLWPDLVQSDEPAGPGSAVCGPVTVRGGGWTYRIGAGGHLAVYSLDTAPDGSLLRERLDLTAALVELLLGEAGEDVVPRPPVDEFAPDCFELQWSRVRAFRDGRPVKIAQAMSDFADTFTAALADGIRAYVRSHPPRTQTVTVGDLKGRWLQHIVRVNTGNVHILVTRRGRPVAVLRPYRNEPRSPKEKS